MEEKCEYRLDDGTCARYEQEMQAEGKHCRVRCSGELINGGYCRGFVSAKEVNR